MTAAATAETNTTATPEFAITRTFDAPQALVWKAWTEPERLARWWGPKGFDLEVKNLDFRPGGSFHYAMRSPQGQTMWGKFIYEQIDPTDRMTFINTFSDEAGGITRNPWMATWPLEVINTLTLTEENGKTTLNLRGGPRNASGEEMATFAGATDSMSAGFAGTFEKLDAYLAEEQGRQGTRSSQ